MDFKLVDIHWPFILWVYFDFSEFYFCFYKEEDTGYWVIHFGNLVIQFNNTPRTEM